MNSAVFPVCILCLGLIGCSTPRIGTDIYDTTPAPAEPTRSASPRQPTYLTFADEVGLLLSDRGPDGQTRIHDVPRSEAYTAKTLPARLRLTPAEIHTIRDDIKNWVSNYSVPTGPAMTLYASGASSEDGWLSYNAYAREYPPSTSSYYEFVYRDGLLVSSTRHDINGKRLSHLILYSENMTPLGAVCFNAEEKPFLFYHLTYDQAGMIKRVVSVDERGEPLFGTCHAITGVYASKESIHYKLRSFGDPYSHTFNDGDRIYRIEPDGSRKEVNRGAPLWWLTRLSKFGVKPFYPLPEGFVVPEFDKFGTPLQRE